MKYHFVIFLSNNISCNNVQDYIIHDIFNHIFIENELRNILGCASLFKMLRYLKTKKSLLKYRKVNKFLLASIILLQSNTWLTTSLTN